MSAPVDPIYPLLSEVIAVHVGERFSRPPRVTVMCLENPSLPVHLPAPYVLQIHVWVMTHFGSLVRGEVLHGFQGPMVNVENVFTAVDHALDAALSKPGPNYLGDTISYLTDKDSWNLFDLADEDCNPYFDGEDWDNMIEDDIEDDIDDD